MSVKPLSVALLGCGRIATRHADLLTNGQIDGAFLVGAVEINEKKRLAFSNKYNVECYESIENLLQHHTVDAVAVLTPSGLHAENVIQHAPLKILLLKSLWLFL